MEPSSPSSQPSDTLDLLLQEIISCRACPRLIQWCEQIAQDKVKRFSSETYWGKPVPSFGPANARLLVVGLAPAAHGGNRTGRVFTGDRSGDWLYRALHRAGFANQPTSVSRDDGLQLIDSYVTAAVHCAPPDNKPTLDEIQQCRPFFTRELQLFQLHLRVIIALGKLAFDATLSQYKTAPKPKPKFGHGAEVLLGPQLLLIGSYHPSQQNTFTGRLTEPMFDAIFSTAKQWIQSHPTST